jgi:3-phenylpropionate/cinnamic acid dioxygenase small subunit
LYDRYFQSRTDTTDKTGNEEVLIDELGENYQGRLDRIENKVDLACKIAKDTQDEHSITQSKVDDHEVGICDLESNFATV